MEIVSIIFTKRICSIFYGFINDKLRQQNYKSKIIKLSHITNCTFSVLIYNLSFVMTNCFILQNKCLIVFAKTSRRTL